MRKKHIKTIDIVYIALSAALITICSWISIPLAVPVTLQTMGVCLVSALFGAKRGTLGVLAYILLGAIGVPVFTGFKGGVGALLGSTGGYILGFLFTAVIVGIAADKSAKPAVLVAAMILGVLVLYTFGTAWFAVVYARTNDHASLATILGWCVVPFIIPDAVKIALATLLASRLKRYLK